MKYTKRSKKSSQPCPEPGKGVHAWICHAACMALINGTPESKIAPLIENEITREPRPNEIEDAIKSAKRFLSRPKHGKHSQEPKPEPKWPKVNREQLAKAIEGGPTMQDLRKLSPFPLIEFTRARKRTTRAILAALFPGNPLLCIGFSKHEAVTKPRLEWDAIELSWAEFIVPSPMSKPEGRTKTGKLSPRTEDNTGPRRFLVIESDDKTLTHDQKAAMLWHLSRFLPLTLVVFSGGKSLHGWFYVQGIPERQLMRFMRYAVSLGADSATWRKYQFVRLPDGERHITRRRSTLQRTLYFNPATINNHQTAPSI
jgi:hypothetical protein